MTWKRDTNLLVEDVVEPGVVVEPAVDVYSTQ